MPNAYINKLVKDGKGTKAALEKKWDAAKESAKKSGKGDNYAYIMSIFKNLAHASVVEAEINNTMVGDVIVLDVPLLIRMFELARETLKSDEILHIVVERMVMCSKQKPILTMEDYPMIWSEHEAQVNEKTVDTEDGSPKDGGKDAGAEGEGKDEEEPKDVKSEEEAEDVIDEEDMSLDVDDTDDTDDTEEDAKEDDEDGDGDGDKEEKAGIDDKDDGVEEQSNIGNPFGDQYTLHPASVLARLKSASKLKK